jgi:serine/threonine-protein phosphatase 6 regulatory ankyrin repeat subunit B
MAQTKEVIEAHNLQNAIRSKNVEKVKKLINDGTDVNIQYNGRNALHVACESGSIELVKIVLSAGANVNSRRDDGQGITTLQNAVRSFSCSFEIIQMLLIKGADVNIGPDGYLAIHYAIMKSGDKKESLRILKLLIEHKANINPDIKENSPLIHSILHRRPDMLEVLLKNGADPNKTGKKSKSPLHYAVENRDIEAVKLLKANGAKVTVKNNEGQTPLDYASIQAKKKNLDPNSKKKYKEIVNILSK